MEPRSPEGEPAFLADRPVSDELAPGGPAAQEFAAFAPGQSRLEGLDLVCFSHLSWDHVYQRPQHLMSRFARRQRVFFVQEPVMGEAPGGLQVQRSPEGVWVAVPHIHKSGEAGAERAEHRVQILQLLAEHNIEQYIAWFFTPMLMRVTRDLAPRLTVYDCMDDLSAFRNAPEKYAEYEAELLGRADLVFTGGASLYEARKDSHRCVYAFPSSIDREHFARARQALPEPEDQARIPRPRLGYFGVIDERMDFDLLVSIADARPHWQLVLVGPFAKLEQEQIPRRPNLHYLGQKPYADLPAYLCGWDAALLPFVRDRSTQYISPTKTPEYLAGGRPVVATPICDVVRPYGEDGLVWIAEGAAKFVRALETILDQGGPQPYWLKRVDEFLSQNSWDQTWERMARRIEAALEEKAGDGPGGSAEGPVGGEPLPPPQGGPPGGAGPASPEGRNGGGSGDEGRTNGQHANGRKHAGGLPGSEAAAYSPRNGRRPGVFDYLIVGAGFAGSVLAERLARGSGKRVLIVDRRPHIGGNAYDCYDENGLLIHKYGPHIFHTNSREVFAYLSRFTQWRPYEHRVLASVDGQLLPIPINLDTVNRMYGLNLSAFELEQFFETLAEPRDPVLTSEDVVISKVGRQLYEKFFRNYTRKQWDLDPSELDAAVTARVPIRLNRDDRYFADTYQAMPLHGYTRMFENLLDHPNIKVLLNTDYREIAGLIPYRELIYSGPVDEYFDYCYGRLPYRSLKFRFETRDERLHQPVAVVNYPNEHPYTRCTEFKHLTGQEHSKTSLVYEYPCAEGDPYYPIPRAENAELYKKYKALAAAAQNVHFVGRLATYKYYNMDQVTAQALSLYARLTGRRRAESTEALAEGRYMSETSCTLLAPIGAA